MSFNRVIVPLCIFFVIGTATTVGIFLFTKQHFFATLLVVLCVKFFIGDIVYRIFSAKNLLKIKEIEQDITQNMAHQYAEVKCPCDKNTKQLVMLNVNEENTYNCNNCDKKLKCLVGWKSFQVTEPLTDDPFKKFNFVENKDYEL